MVNNKTVERIWRQEGLKVPPRQPKRSWISPGDGACMHKAVERAVAGRMRHLQLDPFIAKDCPVLTVQRIKAEKVTPP